MEKVRLLSLTILCPVLNDTAHIPVSDCIRIDWEEKRIVYYCVKCGGNHMTQFKS